MTIGNGHNHEFYYVMLNKNVNKQADLFQFILNVIHARTHAVGGVGNVMKMQAKNVNKL